jgi:dTDP-3-amino-3,4,6-trideoxy-alpha-D-glucose transaminase
MTVPFLELKPAYEELRADLDAASRRVLESGWYIFGREIESFEAEYAAATGAAHCIAVANGLEALQLSLLAAGIGPGDEVIVPSHTYIATWLAVSQVGASLVPCEPAPDSFGLDVARLPGLIGPRTRAILPVHLYGATADMEGIRRVAGAAGLFTVEDAAQSHGATCGGRQSGALGDFAGVSFYPSKNLGALGDAGAVLTRDEAWARRVRRLRNYGSETRYHHEERGLNSRLSELQCAFLRGKLPHLSAWNARRRLHADRYLAGLAGVGDLVLPHPPAWGEHVWHLFVVRTHHRDALRTHLSRDGVATQIHYPIPPHLSGAYRDAGWGRGAFPLAEALADEVLSLPIGPHHTADQIDHVIASLRAFFGAS